MVCDETRRALPQRLIDSTQFSRVGSPRVGGDAILRKNRKPIL